MEIWISMHCYQHVVPTGLGKKRGEGKCLATDISSLRDFEEKRGIGVEALFPTSCHGATNMTSRLGQNFALGCNNICS